MTPSSSGRSWHDSRRRTREQCSDRCWRYFRIPSGYVVADGIKYEIVFLDQQLNPVRRVGGEGEGPGEYQFPAALAGIGELVAVSDPYLQRVQLLSQMGDPLRTVELTHEAYDLALHPQLGLLTTLQRGLLTTLYRPADHYLEVSATRSRLAPIPIELAPKASGPRFKHRVAVSADGSVHVLDNEHLALVKLHGQRPPDRWRISAS